MKRILDDYDHLNVKSIYSFSPFSYISKMFVLKDIVKYPLFYEIAQVLVFNNETKNLNLKSIVKTSLNVEKETITFLS